MNKQIEEMAALICKGRNPSIAKECAKCIWNCDCEIQAACEALRNAGYRKADEVAREIFKEIEDVLNNIGYFDELDFNALKKKYKEESWE